MSVNIWDNSYEEDECDLSASLKAGTVNITKHSRETIPHIRTANRKT